MTRFQRFVLGIQCAQRVLEVMGQTQLSVKTTTWSRSLERLWADVKADPKTNRDLHRGAWWLARAGFVTITKVRRLSRWEKFIALTELGRPVACRLHRDRVLTDLIAELGKLPARQIPPDIRC